MWSYSIYKEDKMSYDGIKELLKMAYFVSLPVARWSKKDLCE